MIRLSLGNVGSGKTLSEVRNMVRYNGKSHYYTNIILKSSKKNIHLLKPTMLMKKELKNVKKKRSGEIEEEYTYNLNIDFWKNQKHPIKVVIDELHNIANSRTSMSRKNLIFNKWLTMIRRVFGDTEAEEGELILISQLGSQVDKIVKLMAHQVRYHICYYIKECLDCGKRYLESSEMPEKRSICCNKIPNLIKHSHFVYIYKFSSIDDYYMWRELGKKTFYQQLKIKKVGRYFKDYNTLQWENLFEDY